MKLEGYKDKIIKMYIDDNIPTTKIAREIGCHASSVERILRKNGVEISKAKKRLVISLDKHEEIVEMYNSGMTTVEIGKAFGVCDNTIAKILRKNGVVVRKAVRRSIVKHHDFFKSIDTKEKAYYLGWMLTDGSIVYPKTRSDRTPIISIELQGQDRYIIEKFANRIGADSSHVRDELRRGRCYSYFRFASKEMADDLAKYGVVKMKTYSAYIPFVEDELRSHLIRGMFDGNGTITGNPRSVRFGMYGTEQVCLDFRNIMHNELGLREPPVSKSTCFHVWWCNGRDTKKFYDYIYNNCEDLYLRRKKEKFEKLLMG